jgi:transcriptional regulator with XRE-family HTH domain
MTDYQKVANELAAAARDSYEYWATEFADEYTEQLCNLMLEKEVSQTDLARLSGCTRQHISNILCGYTNFTIESMAKLALALDHRLELPQLIPTERRVEAFDKTPVSTIRDVSFAKTLVSSNDCSLTKKRGVTNVIAFAA